jgi:PAS domain S-box-containing protein
MAEAMPIDRAVAGDLLFDVVAASSLPMVLTDPRAPDNPIVHANAAFLKLTGYSPQEIVGRNCRLLQGPDTNPAATAAIRRAVAEGEAASIDILNYRRDGGSFWNALTVSPIHDAAGSLRYFLGIQQDIGQRASGDRGLTPDFIALIAHELRNPMTPVLMQVQHLSRLAESSEDALHRHLDRLRLAIDTYMRRATTLLDLARIAAGRLDLKPAAVDLADLTRAAIERHQAWAAAAGSPIGYAGPPEELGWWDRTALEQILDNLLSNAIKYGQGMPITVTLSSTRDTVTLVVHDKGSGIQPSERERVFGPFDRLIGPDAQAGLGIGLWVVRQLVEAMGGNIVVASGHEAGSTFTAIIPRAHRRPESR